MRLSLVTRPIRLVLPAGGSQVDAILARVAGIRGRMSAYGATDPLRAEAIAGQSLELDFDDSYYRDGFVAFGAPSGVPAWSFSRAGAGTATKADGGLVNFASGAPRITDRGLLIETAATNLNPYSENDPGWTAAGTTPPTVSTSTVQDGRTCVSATFAAGAGGYAASRAMGSGFSIASGTPYTASYEVKLSRQLVGSEVVTVYVEGASGGWGQSFTAGQAPTAFVRKTATQIAGGTGGDYFAVVPTNLASPITVWLARRQFEQGYAASSYIPTAGAQATRATDAALLSRPVTAHGTLLAEFIGRASPSDTYPIMGADSFAPLLKTATGVGTFGPTGSHQVDVAVAANETVRAALAWTPDGFRIAAKGVVSDLIPGRVGSWSYLALGWDLGSGTISSPIRRAMLASVTATADELEAMTA